MQVPVEATLPINNTMHNSKYFSEALVKQHFHQEEYSWRLMADKGGRVLAIDAGIKNTGKV